MSSSSSRNVQNQQSLSETQFPSQFLSEYQKIFGPGFGVNELIAGLPRTSGLFGGTAGLQPTVAGQPNASASPMGLGAAQAPAGSVPSGPVQSQPAAPPRSYSANELLGYAAEDPNQQQGINRIIGQLGGQGAGPFTLQQIRAQAEKGLSNKDLGALNSTFARLEAGQQVQQQAPQAPRFTQPAPAVGLNEALPGGIAGATSALGFGNLGQQAQVQDIRNLPTINAPTVDMTNLPGYEKAVFESQFRPVERELSRQSALQQQTLASELAQRGLAGSGAGIGQQQRAQRETGQQIQFAAEDAANRASVQRFQQEYQQKLANAGFNLDAQKENAHNILLGDTAKAKNYLDTIGLNADTAAKAKASFLGLLGVQQEDLKRMDAFSLSVTDRLLNTWLQTASTLATAGQKSIGESQGAGTSKSAHFFS